MRRIYWDTMLYIYWFDNNQAYVRRIEEIYKAMQRRRDALCSSSLVFAEVLVGPSLTKDQKSIDTMTSFFHSSEVSILPFPLEASPIFATLRASGIKAPDAINLAIAAHSGVDLFLTNDKRLHKVSQPGMPFIATLETDIF